MRKRRDEQGDKLILNYKDGRLVLMSEPLDRIKVSSGFIDSIPGASNSFTVYAQNGDPVVYEYDSTIEEGRTWWFRRAFDLRLETRPSE